MAKKKKTRKIKYGPNDEEVTERVIQVAKKLKTRRLGLWEAEIQKCEHEKRSVGKFITVDEGTRYEVYLQYDGHSRKDERCPMFGTYMYTINSHYYKYGLKIEIRHESPVHWEAGMSIVSMVEYSPEKEVIGLFYHLLGKRRDADERNEKRRAKRERQGREEQTKRDCAILDNLSG